MEDNRIELFDRYVDGKMNEEESSRFKERLSSEQAFLTDFRAYLLILKGIYQEADQDNIEFGEAMSHISEKQLKGIMGSRKGLAGMFRSRLRERVAWISSIAAILIIGVFSVFQIQRNSSDNIDNLIVAYNYIPEGDRGGETLTADDIPSLEKAYRDAPADDIQAQEVAGLRLAMGYLKIHDRAKAKATLSELKIRFADDEEFVAQCDRILSQLK